VLHFGVQILLAEVQRALGASGFSKRKPLFFVYRNSRPIVAAEG